MKILAIDTATASAAVAVMEDDILISEYILNHKKTHSQKLMHIIHELLTNCGMKPVDIDLFACSSGPGSFTGLRIGAATLKGMAQALGKPLAAVPTLDALAYNLYGAKGIICPILDAQRGMVYSALYTWRGSELTKEADLRAIAMEDLLNLLKEKNLPVTFLGEAVPLFESMIKEKLPEALFAPSAQRMPRASSIGVLALDMHKKGVSESYKTLKPIYIRKSQAEVEYEKKQTVEVTQMKREDVEQVHDIESLSFLTPWSLESFVDEMEKNQMAKYMVAKIGEKIVGYGGMWLVLDEAHITNVAVHPEYREQKIGEKIVQALVGLAKAHNIVRMTLEVRTGNGAARNLYRKMGFEEFGIRKGYYTDTGEDAVIMWKELE